MPSRRLTPGRRVWSALIVLMALAAVVEAGVFQDALTHGWGGRWLGHLGWMLGLLVAVLALLASLTVGLRVNAGVSPRTDRFFWLMAFSWMLGVLCHVWQYVAPEAPWGQWAVHASYQLTVTTAAAFILACAPLDAPRLRWLCWFHLILTQALVVGDAFGLQHHDILFQAGRILNVAFGSTVLIGMAYRLWSPSEPHAWLVLGAGLTGWGVALSDVVPASIVDVSPEPAHYVLAAYLLMLWLLTTRRVGHVPPDRALSRERTDNSVLGDAFANSQLAMNAIDSAGILAETSEQITKTRRRIAQDLHDGVGSQIVSMIASLDPNVPQQRDMVSALEHCLLDVKILVDDIDESHESVLDALGRLRYRVQHSLDRLCIALRWEVETDGPLERMNDDRSRQVLRVAQEALANVMRHSQATQVCVRCNAEDKGTVLVLEVHDNGGGFEVPTPGRSGGRGLVGMRRRAQAIQGELSLLSEPGCGTLVQLRVPL